MTPLGLFGSLGGPELLVILLILVILFGARRIPELARGLGEGIRNFRTALKGDESASEDEKKQVEGSDAPRGGQG